MKIDAKYLTKRYKNGSYALKNCSFSTSDGEFLVVVGASGAGKSTLLKVLAGVTPLSSGELYLDGIFADSIPTQERSVSMAFQECLLYPHMTVFDNLAAPLKQAGEDAKSIYDRVMAMLRFFGLEVAADVKPGKLSGGEQQRVSLAKALLKRSKLVLLDEPMSSVDERSRWEYCQLLKKMKQMLPASTFVYVTHNAKEAIYLADRIAFMRDGQICCTLPKGWVSRQFGEDLTADITTALPLCELRLDGCLKGSTLTFAGKSIELDEEYISRLLRAPERVSLRLAAEKFEKAAFGVSFPLIFEVMENAGDHAVLNAEGQNILLSRKTALREGERIRLYYKMEDIVLYDGEERLTCHYPLHQRIKIKVLDPQIGKIASLGKVFCTNAPIPRDAQYALTAGGALALSSVKGRYAVGVEGCLDEEFINGKKLSHIAVKGADSYLSTLGETEPSCFGKEKVWLNIYPDKLTFLEGDTT